MPRSLQVVSASSLVSLALLSSALGCSKPSTAPIRSSAAPVTNAPAAAATGAASPTGQPAVPASVTAGPSAGAPAVAPAPATTTPSDAAPTPAKASSAASVSASPAAPVQRTIPAGTSLAVRINQNLSSKDSNAGDPFSGELVSPVRLKGGVVLPAGSTVNGEVSEAHAAGRFKGGATLALRLVSVTVRGRRYPVQTASVSTESKGKGKRTGALIGGGGGGGALIGGLAGGGKGALIGGLIGAGAGTAGAGLTGNRDITYRSETILNFRLTKGLTVAGS